MAEYIEREKILNHLEETKAGIKTPAWEWLIDSLLKCYKTFPAADVEKVVYCKECKHLYCCSAVDRQFYCRHIHGMKGCLNPIEENPFCSYGERKDN